MFAACIHCDWAGIVSNCSMLMAYDSLNSLNPTLNAFFIPQLQSGYCSKNQLPHFCPEASLQHHDRNSCYLMTLLVYYFGGSFLLVFLEKGCFGIPEDIHLKIHYVWFLIWLIQNSNVESVLYDFRWIFLLA